MHIRCPQCQVAIDIVNQDPLAQIDCPSCGATFSLIRHLDTRAYEPGTESYPASPPKRIAHFELLNQVGAGAYGWVWKARDTILERIVALKIPRFAQLSPQNIDYFFRDARAAAQLRHPNIVSVHEVGRDGDTVFIASDFIEGANLREWLSVGGLLIRDAAELVRKVAEAVHHAHERGVVHRDLKPANILLDLEGNPHITDFGVAKRETGEATVTAEGQLVGTAQYMSPEQAAGKGHQADARSDVYSLGVILFELLTGEVPFRGEMRMLVVQILNEEPPRLRKFNARVPRDLETICLKCLEKDPRRRYGTAQELADDLRRYLDGQPIQARPIGKLNRGWRWARRNPIVAGLSGLLLATLLSIAVIGPAVAIHQAELRGEAELAEAERADQLWRSLLNQARANRMSGRPGRRFKSLEALKEGLAIVRERGVDESEYLLDFRNEAIAALAQSDLDVLKQWQGIPPTASQQDRQWGTVNVDAQMQRYLRSDAKGNITLRRIADDHEILSLPGPGLTVAASIFSPDGRFLAVRYGLNRPKEQPLFRIWSLDSGKLHMTTPYAVRNAAFNFSRDSKQLAVGTMDPDAPRTDASAGKPAAVFVYDLACPESPTHEFAAELPEQCAFDADGRRLAVTNDLAKVVTIYDLKTGDTVATLPHTTNARGVDWSRDGKHLATGDGPAVLVWDADRWQPVELKPTFNQVTHVTFNGTGDLVASRSWDYVIRLWDVAARRELIQVPGGSQWAPLTFNRDDSALAFAHDGSEGSIYKVATGRELRRLVTRAVQQVEGNADSPFRAMDFSRDGRWLIVGNDAHSHLWDLQTGDETLLPIPMPVIGYQQPVRIAFSTDGSELLCAGEEGIERWPLELDSSQGALRIGPPEKVHQDLRNFFSVSDRYILGLTRSSYDQVALLDRSDKGSKVIVSHPTPTTAVADPHGKWLATAAWKEPDVKVWDASTGELLRAIPAVSPVCISLSPDGRLLCVGTEDAYREVDTETWQTRFEIPRRRALGASGHSVFSDDGKLMAACSSFATLQLIDPKQGTPIAELQTPHERRIGYFCFNHDGDRLAVRYLATNAVEIWDLRAIRWQLDELGLDWDLPSYAPAPKRKVMPLEVIVDAGRTAAESP